MRGIEWRLSHRNRPVSSRDLMGGPNRAPPPPQVTYSRKPTSNRVKKMNYEVTCRPVDSCAYLNWRMYFSYIDVTRLIHFLKVYCRNAYCDLSRATISRWINSNESIWPKCVTWPFVPRPYIEGMLIRPKQHFPCRRWYEESDGCNAIQWKMTQLYDPTS